MASMDHARRFVRGARRLAQFTWALRHSASAKPAQDLTLRGARARPADQLLS
jgi:hypothetical protein